MLHRGVLARSRTRRLPGRYRHVLVSLAILVFLGPHLWVVAAGEERYPLTSAAMFAYPVDAGTPRYTMHLTGELAEAGTTGAGPSSHQLIEFDEVGAHPRHLFSHTWGSAWPGSYHTFYPDDTPEAFAERLGAWLGGFHRSLEATRENEPVPAALTLWLQPVHPEVGSPRPIVRYDVPEDQVILHPDEVWPALVVSTS